MSVSERTRLEVMARVLDGELSSSQAATLLGFSYRQLGGCGHGTRRAAMRGWCIGCGARCPTARSKTPRVRRC